MSAGLKLMRGEGYTTSTVHTNSTKSGNKRVPANKRYEDANQLALKHWKLMNSDQTQYNKIQDYNSFYK